jgi:hypothetical protein
VETHRVFTRIWITHDAWRGIYGTGCIYDAEMKDRRTALASLRPERVLHNEKVDHLLLLCCV